MVAGPTPPWSHRLLCFLSARRGLLTRYWLNSDDAHCFYPRHPSARRIAGRRGHARRTPRVSPPRTRPSSSSFRTPATTTTTSRSLPSRNGLPPPRSASASSSPPSSASCATPPAMIFRELDTTPETIIDDVVGDTVAFAFSPAHARQREGRARRPPRPAAQDRDVAETARTSQRAPDQVRRTQGDQPQGTRRDGVR